MKVIYTQEHYDNGCASYDAPVVCKVVSFNDHGVMLKRPDGTFVLAVTREIRECPGILKRVWGKIKK